jgi:hypothetical protein
MIHDLVPEVLYVPFVFSLSLIDVSTLLDLQSLILYFQLIPFYYHILRGIKE